MDWNGIITLSDDSDSDETYYLKTILTWSCFNYFMYNFDYILPKIKYSNDGLY